MPGQPKMSPQNVQRLIDRNLQFLDTITLETADYQAAIAQMTTLNLPGGGIFDALIARAALKVAAQQLMTLNPKHFTRLDTAIAQIVVVPS
jgi:predicted nucleic acid-binding protein